LKALFPSVFFAENVLLGKSPEIIRRHETE
jgi:hypothetical protein